MSVRVRSVEPADAAAWERMRERLWPSAEGEHAGEIAAWFAGDLSIPAEVLIAEVDAGNAIGFVELAIRGYAEECYSGRVAYLEGWYVEPEARRRGVGTALIRAAEEWGRALGCVEMASDAALENEDEPRGAPLGGVRRDPPPGHVPQEPLTGRRCDLASEGEPAYCVAPTPDSAMPTLKRRLMCA